MNFFYYLFFPLKWVIEAILVVAHNGLTALGMNPGGGLAWLLAVAALVVVLRLALLPTNIHQYLSQQKMVAIAPRIQEVQAKYRPKLSDPAARQKMSAELSALYKEAGTHPLQALLPVIIQIIVFICLFQVLLNADSGKAGVGMLNLALATSFSHASLFGIPLTYTILLNHGMAAVAVLGLVILALMTIIQTITQYMIMVGNTKHGTLAETSLTSRVTLYINPIVSVISTFAFPLQMLFYWLFSNLWTLIQQYLLLRFRPLPGSDRAKRYGR